MDRRQAKALAHEQVLFKGKLGSLGEHKDPAYLDALSHELYVWLRQIAEEQAKQMVAARREAERESYGENYDLPSSVGGF